MAANATTFEKGRKKTGGRKAGTKNKRTLEIEELCREHATKAVEALVNMAENPKHPAHFSATQEILNRAYGKPKQVQQHIGDKDNPLEVNHTITVGSILKKLDAIAERKEP